MQEVPHLYVLHGFRDTDECLLQHGADLNAKVDKDRPHLYEQMVMFTETLLNYFYSMAPLLMQ